MSALAPFKGYFKLVDWRLVAAIGLPLWAFVIGTLVTWKPTSAKPPEVALAPAPLPSPPLEPAPAPREVVIRNEFVPLPVAVPVITADDSFAVPVLAEFKLPSSELMPGDRCKTYETKVRFHPTLVDAADEARKAKKMLFVLHISGDFEDPGFT